MFKRHPWRRAGFVASIVVVAVLMMTTTAFAQGRGRGGGGGGQGGGHGGGGGGETTTNNLSVPAIFLGTTNPYGLTCDGTYLKTPDGAPSTGYPVDPAAYYYVQGINTWQAQCAYGPTDSTVHATADWGDNLTSAPLRAGHPIRVEVGLIYASGATVVPTTGYDVIKLDPNALDRVSAYGTLATPLAGGGFTAPTSTFPLTKEVYDRETGGTITVTIGQRIFDAGATLKIASTDGSRVVYDGPATAEINRAGAVVYGFNWGRSSGTTVTAGTYTITFTAPNATLDNADAGSNGHIVTLGVTVSSGGFGGGGGGH